MAAADMKKPQTAYFLWLNASGREEIWKLLGTKDPGQVGKKAGEMWRAMTASAKAPFEKQAKEQKDAWEKYKNTDAGKKALEEQKADRKEAKQEKLEKNAKKAAKAVEKDEKLKKPASAYFLFTNDKREEVQKSLGTKDFSAVTKKIVELWKGMSDLAKKPWEDKAKAQKEAYDKYVASPEGAAALAAYKEQVKEAKDGVKGKRAADAEEPEKKRAKSAVAGA